MDYTYLLVLAVISSFMMSWAIGANDVANAMGTSVGSRSISVKQAIVIAGIFEALGAFTASGQVTQTLRQGIVSVELFQDDPLLLVLGMLSALFASATWLIVATYKGWPVSTTHTIIGAIIGFALLSVGYEHVQWDTVIDIVLSWILTPLIAGFAAYFIFRSIYRFILATKDPMTSANRWLPVYVFITLLVTLLVSVLQGLRPLGIYFPVLPTVALSFLFCAVIAFFSGKYFQKKNGLQGKSDPFHFKYVESSFGVLTVFTACSMAFAHGSNDVANAIGPLAAIVDILVFQHDLAHQAAIPIWVVALGSVGVVSGLAMYGYKIMDTVGSKITALTPSRSFSAQMATAIVIIISSGLGLPVSTTQTLVGSLLGVGMARGIGALNLNVVRSIFSSWVVTVPCGALLAMGYFILLKQMVKIWLVTL